MARSPLWNEKACPWHESIKHSDFTHAQERPPMLSQLSFLLMFCVAMFVGHLGVLELLSSWNIHSHCLFGVFFLHLHTLKFEDWRLSLSLRVWDFKVSIEVSVASYFHPKPTKSWTNKYNIAGCWVLIVRKFLFFLPQSWTLQDFSLAVSE